MNFRTDYMIKVCQLYTFAQYFSDITKCDTRCSKTPILILILI